QVAKVAIPLEIVPLNLMRALNSHLPDDIRVLNAEVSTEEFIPTYHAKSKEYHYRFTVNRTHAALQSDLIANQSFELDIEKMREACRILIGEHDFSNFF